ncbi:MlaE family ABC transporter permease [Oceanisphaera avium]|uniref:ABC transporter permease n=2 Tax=Oceanisphaera avium TaxID=1903694 RepID=A0A1Y0CZM3_9GAMM|nr:ABC transporter permease [Oceanisphaera avium]ART80782.1 ABC transporter permease [Oceanisphaera avium]
MPMQSSSSPPQLHIENGQVQLIGHWTLRHFNELSQLAPLTEVAPTALDASALHGLDTAGAALLIETLGAQVCRQLLPKARGLSAERQALLGVVLDAMVQEAPAAATRGHWLDAIARLGQHVMTGWQQFVLLLGFMGLTLASLGRNVLRPSQWRLTALVVQIQQCGLNAVPIVALLTFLVGAVVAFLGATVLENFGATIYTVELVAYSFLREFGVLLSAILLAGRTASAFTAQLGAMKVNEELDALRTQGLDPMELLVLPRILALVLALPLLTFIGMISGLIGGALVCLLALDISIAQYLTILQQVPVQHVWVGLGKAPIFAFLIALIGCLEGFKVSGSAQSVGEHTTSSVVQSIFVVILLDAVAALFLMEMAW